VLHSKYETPHIIDTDVDQCLLVWPMCDGRDVDVSIKENYLSLEIKLAPLQYQNNHTYFQFFTNRKKSPGISCGG